MSRTSIARIAERLAAARADQKKEPPAQQQPSPVQHVAPAPKAPAPPIGMPARDGVAPRLLVGSPPMASPGAQQRPPGAAKQPVGTLSLSNQQRLPDAPMSQSEHPAGRMTPAAEPVPDVVAIWGRPRLVGFRPVKTPSAKGFIGVASFELAGAVIVAECPVHVKEGSLEIRLPTRPELDPQGRRVPRPDGKGFIYRPVLAMPPALARVFCEAAATDLMRHRADLLDIKAVESSVAEAKETPVD
jgi:hypothetical protein